MKTKLLLLVATAQLAWGAASAQWTNISPDTASDFTSVFFTTPLRGYAIGCEKNAFTSPLNHLHITTDGGATWTSSIGSDLCPPAVFFADSNTGYFFTEGSAPGVHKTTDGGAHWTMVHSGLPGVHVFFVDELTGYATGANTMAKTTDGGVTWTPQTLSGPSILDAVHYVNKDTGLVGGWYNSVIARTTDGGSTWTFPTFDYGIHAMHFASALVGYAAGEDIANNNPVVLKTTDGGLTWSVKYRITTAAPFYFSSVHAIGANICYTAGVHGTLLKTTDGGVTWSQEAIGTTKSINSVYCRGNTCYVAGDSGVLLKTAIGGVEGAAAISHSEAGVTIHPNPFTDHAIITISGAIPPGARLELYDVTGRRVAVYTITASSTVIRRGRLTAGVYIYKLYGGQECVQGKMVVE